MELTQYPAMVQPFLERLLQEPSGGDFVKTTFETLRAMQGYSSSDIVHYLTERIPSCPLEELGFYGALALAVFSNCEQHGGTLQNFFEPPKVL